ncbi:hypothetical protein R70723_05355 [Paenibacillus sp. FSL R7-0273]|uniref:hypothetical protein n=1 Tax=Paenibacillus sp. FSL R7-0273 TaxID=1536772 RepID=UPI0004F58563|nr:hypothetical protein [Paenibacillus sp. FSL R7-0273]AIQ45386.1 hypothetical protein R70723_05355 [Paenibacillus sp. FSL R7-0273]OMF89986.1 hypothetical protein BK144_18535 [Paenibacillus sp. FSL R7-0273]
MNKIRRTAAVIAVLGIVALAYMWLRPQPFDQEYSSVIYTNEAGQAGSTVLVLAGEKFRGLPGKSRFNGSLVADGDLRYELKLKESGSYYLGVISEATGNGSTQTAGMVTASLALDKIWVVLTEVNERYGLKGQDGYIAGPAHTLEEAKQVARDIIGPE